MLKKILIALAIVAVVLAVVISMKPDEFRVTRSTTISAPAEAIFPLVNDLKLFGSWNPWAEVDPNAKTTFEGPAQGVGSAMRWDGNSDVGSGSMTNTETRPDEFIQYRMDFLTPMEATSTAEFTFKPIGGQTEVSWTMYGKNNFMAKAMSLFIDCDTMVGEQFEKGLANLKTLAEKR